MQTDHNVLSGGLITAAQLVAADLPPRHAILDPILARHSLVMLYGPRGLGKTFVGLGIAVAVASGGSFLKWRAPRPQRVLYLDGEMPAVEMKQRLMAMGAPPMLDFVISDLMRGSTMPDLGRREGLTALMHLIAAMPEKPALVVLDNLASLVGFTHNDPDTWNEVQRWLLGMRSVGAAVLVLHHANKDGDQRGTSRREDVLDVVLSIRRPAGYAAREGARIELHFDKARGLHGEQVDPMEVRLETDETGRLRWQWRPAHIGELERLAALLNEGLNPSQAASELGISRAKSYRLRQKAVGMGLLKLE
jgi:hypothetical protein